MEFALLYPRCTPRRPDDMAASAAPFMRPDSFFIPLQWTFAALRCRDLAESSLAKNFAVLLGFLAKVKIHLREHQESREVAPLAKNNCKGPLVTEKQHL